MALWDVPYCGAGNESLAEIEHFPARGMKRVYGRGDHFPSRPAFNMDVWRDRQGRLLARFWSRSGEVDWESWEILGIPVPESLSGPPFDEQWVPDCLRKQYDTWIISN